MDQVHSKVSLTIKILELSNIFILNSNIIMNYEIIAYNSGSYRILFFICTTLYHNKLCLFFLYMIFCIAQFRLQLFSCVYLLKKHIPAINSF